MTKNNLAGNGRLLSLDALRGFDMMFIMGLSGIIVSICSLFPDGDTSWLAMQMSHVKWEGFHHHDTIFALFLFISGMTFPFSSAKKLEKGLSKGDITKEVLKRACILFFLGLVYQGFFHFHFATLRVMSVLGRIGIAWALAAIIYCYTGRKTQYGIAAGILIGYFLLLKFTIAPDAPAGADSMSKMGNIPYYIDRIILGNHAYKPYGDPEGLLSTIPAIVTALLGMFTGRYVKESDDSGEKKTLKLLGAAVVTGVAAALWSIWFPVIKNLWTSTFVLAAASYSLAVFAIFYYIIDVKGWRKGVIFFQVVGMNSITIYLAQAFIDFQKIGNFFLSGVAELVPEVFGAVILRIGYFTAAWLMLYFMYKKNVFLKV